MVKRTVSGSVHRLPIACALGLLVAGSTLGMAHRPKVQHPPATVSTTPMVKESQVSVPTLDDRELSVDPELKYLSLRSSASPTRTRSNRPMFETYIVKDADTVWIISRKFGTNMDTLLSFNPDIEVDNLTPGISIRLIPDFVGALHTVSEGQTIEQLATIYAVPADSLLIANGLDSSSVLTSGDELLIPGARQRVVLANRGDTPHRNAAPEGTAPMSVKPSERGQTWIWPITGGLYFSEYGPREGDFHSGLDIAVPSGTPVVAVQSGVVTFAGWDAGYGYSVIVDHGGGLLSRYAHASSILVEVGQSVGQGEKVILVGSTGRATGPHLHLEVLNSGTPVNPRNYLP